VRLTADAVDTRVLRSIGRDLGGWNFTTVADGAKRLVKPRVVKELGETGDALRGVFAKQGYRGTLQVLETADNTADVRRLERMSDRLGGRFRGALFLKRGAKLTFHFAELFFTVIVWLAGAVLWLLWASYFSIRMLARLGRILLRMASYTATRRRGVAFPLQSPADGSI
jgi:hypothetical protein